MRILVFPQKLAVRGATLTAIDLASELVRRHHDVHIFAESGPLVPMLEPRGLVYHEAPQGPGGPPTWPSRHNTAELRRVAREVEPDVVHTYEWAACLEALFGAYVLDGVPLLASIMSMRVPRFIPHRIPLVVGTRVLRDDLLRQGRPRVTLVEPPVDVDRDHPDHQGGFRAEHGIPDGAVVAAIVSRLDDLKLQSTTMAIEAVAAINGDLDVRLVITGDGPRAKDVRALAAAANDRAGRAVVTLTGVLDDPRGVYAASDIVIGMGGSALRGLAFAKPLVVVGTEDYVDLFTPETSGEFLVQGFWGLGPGRDGADRLAATLGSLAADPDRRSDLGAFGRRFVVERFSLGMLAGRLEDALADAVSSVPGDRDRRGDALIGAAKLSAIRARGSVHRARHPAA